jgi:endonuclease III
MRVKISYTVELEEVEKEVAEIMAKAAEKLDHAYHEISGLQALMDTQTGDVEQSIQSIDFVRKQMMKADQVLDDCHLILQGYKQALKQLEEKGE